MTDKNLGLDAAGGATATAPACTPVGGPRWRIGPLGTALVALALAGAVGVYVLRHEGGPTNQAFVAATTLLIAAVLVFLTRSVLASAVLTAGMAGIIVLASAAKVKLMHVAIHSYDVVYYLSSIDTLSFLWDHYRGLVLQLFGGLAAATLAACVVYRLDATRVRRSWAGGAVLVLLALTLVSVNMKDGRNALNQFEEDLALSTFYTSWPETIDTLWRGQLMDAAVAARGPQFSIPDTCTPADKPPHIILIHQESVVPPEYFPALGYDRSVDRMFRSADGKLHRLRTETFAGASWLTEFSLFAGVSTYHFGSMRPFVQALMAGKVHDSLPQALARCGYRNVVFYPLSKNFVSNGRFYEAIGMPEIFDMTAQRTSRQFERDRVFYRNALSLMEQHFKTSDQPLFTFVLTMATHQPYTFTLYPETDVPGGAPGTEPGMHEFLRRLSMANIDYAHLKSELKRRFPDERFLIVHYGDHQPTSTWSYLKPEDRAAILSKDPQQAKDSEAYVTYYAVDGINFDPAPLPDVETLDIPYLGLALLKAAGLPLSDSFTERDRLMRMCQGRYYGCAEESQILAFHRRLIDSGLVEAR